MSIYKITVAEKYIYIGSCKKINKRKWNHKHACTNHNNKDYNFKLYRYIRENGGWEKIKFEILEEDLNDDELLHVEDFYERLTPENLRLNDHRVIPTNLEKKYWLRENNKIKKRIWNKQRTNCPYCQLDVSKKSLWKHKKRCKKKP